MDGPVELPDKLFFKIGEVSRLVGVEPYVLRYWESEFRGLRPRKSRGGQRLYRRADVEMLLRIKQLLREEGFTISGAKKRLSAERNGAEEPSEPEPSRDPEQVARLVAEIERLKAALEKATADRADAVRKASGREETLRALRKEIEALSAALRR